MKFTIYKENQLTKITFHHIDTSFNFDIYESNIIGNQEIELTGGKKIKSNLVITLQKNRNEIFPNVITDSFGRDWAKTEKYNEYTLIND